MRKFTRQILKSLTRLSIFTLMFIQVIGTDAQINKPAAGKQPGRPTSKISTAKSIQTLSGQPRYALVIGNGFYTQAAMRLSNTLNDAAVIAASLRRTGFQVTEKNNLTLAEMRGAIQEFSRQLPDDAVGLFFFAGHGLQVSGRNFLLPVDYTDAKDEKDFLTTQLDLDGIIAAITRKSGLTIIVLDTCRSNGLGLSLTFQTEQGFSSPRTDTGGIYIAYSTAPGMTAYDGNGNNSPYSKALAQNLLMSPGRLEDIFIKTRIEVENETAVYPNGEQVPWENGSLNKIFYFTPDKLRSSLTVSSPNPESRPTLVKPGLPQGIKNLLKFSFTVPHLDNRGIRIGLNNKTADYFLENLRIANLAMVEIPGGRFQMGTSSEEVEQVYQDALKSNDAADREVITAEMPQHAVNVPGFFMSKTEITQGQWRAVMGNPPEIPEDLRGDDLPVVNVTWKEANKFCDVLSGKTGRNYCLPTEAEWEYAARAGTETRFAYGDNINSNYVNFFALVPFGEGLKGEFRRKTTAVGQMNAPNNFGIDDIYGNVSEWCADYWHSDYNGAPSDGGAWNDPAKRQDEEGDDPALYRVIRGGSFESIGNNCRSAARRAMPATDDTRYSTLGFRVILSK